MEQLLSCQYSCQLPTLLKLTKVVQSLGWDLKKVDGRSRWVQHSEGQLRFLRHKICARAATQPPTQMQLVRSYMEYEGIFEQTQVFA